MSDDPDDETPGKPSIADDTQVQIKGDDDQVRIKEEETEEEPEVDKSVREEESKDIYDFFKSHRWLYQLGSDDDFSIIRRSEKQPETIYVYMTIPPDGGWGWVIVVVSFICNATIDGICLTYGRLIPDLTKDMNIDVSKAITISSLMNGMYFLVGPVVSAIANKVGFRPVAMVGGVICAVSVFGGSYCRTWLGLTVCYGFIAGWGFGMVMAPATIIVGYYFEKYRALVTGIAICGSGVGTLIFSPIYGDFVDRYGWRNTLRLQAAFCLLVAILAFLFRPLLPVRVAQIKEPEPGTPSDVESEQSVELDFASYSKFFPTIHPSSQQDNASIRTNATPVIEPNAPIVQHLKRYDPHSRRRLENFCLACWWKIFCRKRLKIQKPIMEISRRDLNLVIESRPLFRRDIFYPGSLGNLPEFQQNQDLTLSIMRPLPQQEDQTARITYNVSMMHPNTLKRPKKRPLHIPPVILQGLTLLFDVRLFAFGTFQLLVLSCFFFVVGANIPYMFVTSRGDENGIDSKLTNWFISLIGVSNTIFRLVAGLVSFLPKFDSSYLSAIVLLISGFLTFVSGFVGQANVTFQLIYCVIFGSGSAFFNTLKQVIFVRCLGLDNLTNAFGISSLIMGIATLIGMPIGGILRDATGNADATFMYGGLSIILSGVLQALVPLCLKHQQAKHARKQREAKKLAAEKRKKEHVK